MNEFQEPGGGGAGVAEQTGLDAIDTDGPTVDVEHMEGGEGEGEVGGEAHQQQQQPPAEPMVPLSQMMNYVQQQPQQQQPQRELTQEEIDGMLHTVRVNEELAQAIFGVEVTEAQIAALQQFADAIIKNSTTVSNYALSHMGNQLSSQFSPALEMARQQRDETFFTSLTQQYPALKGHEQTMRTVLDQVRQSGYVAKDGNEAARIIAGQTEALIKTVNPQFSLQSTPAQQTNGQQGGMPQMAPLSGGAGGGQAGAQTGKSKAPTGLDVFG